MFLKMTPVLKYFRYSNDFATSLKPNVGEWSHVVFRYDFNNQSMSVALNGVIQTDPIKHSSFNGTTNVLIGRTNLGYFTGGIDEVLFSFI